MSEFFEIFFIGLILSIDSFSAAIAMGTRPFLKKDAIKFAFTSGVSEALVALIGAFAGAYLIKKFQAFDHWIAFSLLMAVSLNMAYEGFSDLFCKEKKEEKSDFHGFFKILIVSLATSLEAFGVGIGLGIAKDSVSLYYFN
ncbi:MAG: hypothetical protein FJ368_05430, partial [Pelagibacterales bacterium]|nr:hypothetical protein [Pelagibacterales bacterium]